MAITIHPKVGQILLCDFSAGFKNPEMVKSGRPVVVLSPLMQGRPNLVTVVALSTKRPDPIMPFHLELPRAALPQLGRFQEQSSWVKGDMVYSVGFHRLDLIKLGKRDSRTGKRMYFTRCLSKERMREIYGCVMHGLNLGHVAPHI
ncbi:MULTISPECIES: type II toxin-antitoxin system PemK/MazF family toxin [unclassified Thioalkalivibrio]